MRMRLGASHSCGRKSRAFKAAMSASLSVCMTISYCVMKKERGAKRPFGLVDGQAPGPFHMLPIGEYAIEIVHRLVL